MFASLSLFAQQQQMPDLQGALDSAASTLRTILIVTAVLSLFYIACYWIIFTKAGYPGWASLIPIYNTLVFIWMAGKPTWWIILLFIPLVNIIILIMLLAGFCENFGKGVGFAIGLIFLGFIFLPILAFGSAEYIGPRGDA